jgi:hypothetical protein
MVDNEDGRGEWDKRMKSIQDSLMKKKTCGSNPTGTN